MTKVYQTIINLNVQKEKKEEFTVEWLIPLMKQIREENKNIEIFYMRTIDIGPVINIYYRNIDNPDKIHSKFSKLTDAFKKDQEEVLQENDIYFKYKKSLAIMNGKKESINVRKEYINFSCEFKEMDRLKRYGEYSSIDEEEIFNNWLFKYGSLIEESTAYLWKQEYIEKQKFLISIFMNVSKRLNGVDLDGYMSFKSHYLGFVATSRKKMTLVNQKLNFKFESERSNYKYFYDNKTGYQIEMSVESLNLFNKWNLAINDFTDEMKKQKNFRVSFLTILNMLRFKSMSKFHNKAFKITNLSFYKSDQFQRYRKLVNLIYIILPNMGFNTTNRLYTALCLIKIIEEEIYAIPV